MGYPALCPGVPETKKRKETKSKTKIPNSLLGVSIVHIGVIRAFAHGAMGRRIDPSWGGPIELFLIPASAPRLV